MCAFIQLLGELSAAPSLPSEAMSQSPCQGLGHVENSPCSGSSHHSNDWQEEASILLLEGDMATLPPEAKVTAACTSIAGAFHL